MYVYAKKYHKNLSKLLGIPANIKLQINKKAETRVLGCFCRFK